jgi:hypothetical protein
MMERLQLLQRLERVMEETEFGWSLLMVGEDQSRKLADLTHHRSGRGALGGRREARDAALQAINAELRANAELLAAPAFSNEKNQPLRRTVYPRLHLSAWTAFAAGSVSSARDVALARELHAWRNQVDRQVESDPARDQGWWAGASLAHAVGHDGLRRSPSDH